MMGKFKNRIGFVSLAIIGILMAGYVGISCKNSKEEYLTEADFKTVDKIDIHCHLNTKRPVFMEQAVADNFRILTINTDAPIGVTIEEQRELAVFQREAFPNHLAFLTSFSMEGWGTGEWLDNTFAYLKEHPEYHMYLHPEYPSYEKQIAARDRMLEKHPDLIFMGAHLGSLEWSVYKMAEHFERFPNSTMDMAERICHIQVQAQEDWGKVRDFFIKYQDRILYGTDRGDYEGAEADPQKLKEKVHEVWKSDWKFFTTDETITSWKVDGEFKGLKLPKRVIEKIYFKNAERIFPEFKTLKN